MEEVLNIIMEGESQIEEPINITDKVLNEFVINYAEEDEDGNAIYLFVTPEKIMLFKLDPASEELIIPILPIYINTSSIVLKDDKPKIFVYDKMTGVYVDPEEVISMNPDANVFHYDEKSDTFLTHKPEIMYED